MKNILSLKLTSFFALCLQVIFFNNSAQAAQQEQAYTTSYRYDLSGRLTGTISPDPDGSGSLRLLATRNTYDSSTGLLITIEKGELSSWADETKDVGVWNAYGFTIYSKQDISYDSYGRKATVKNSDRTGSGLSLTEYSYDDKSRVLCTALRMNLTATGNACTSTNLSGANPDRISRFTYDDFDQVTTEERAVGTSIQQTYVTNTYVGRTLASQKDANGNRTDLRYNTNWQLEKVVYPSPTVTGAVNESDYVSFTYDSNGNKNYERKRNGTSITYTIDNNNRVIFKDYSNPSQQDISYNYDLRGLQLSAKFGSDSGIGIANTFDGFGNVSSTTNSMFSAARTLAYKYDLNNNRTEITHQDGAKFTYTFDGLNRIAQIVDPSNSSLLSVNYQANGRRLNIARSNGTSTEYSFQNGVQLDSFKQSFVTTANNLTNTFAYNKASQITDLTLGNSLYYYQGNENRTGAYVTNGLNQYKKIDTILLDYDTNQNLKYDGMTYYNYDDENRLLSMTKLDDGSFGANLVYDPNGRLFQTTINGTITKFLYDGDALIGEYSGNTGELLRRYVHGDQVDEPLVQYNGSSTAKANGTIASSTLTAASATFVGSHVLATNNTGYTGATGFIDFVGEGEAKWSLNIATTSTYVISVRYALISPDRPLTVMVDGVQKAILSFPDTKTWNTWSTVKVSIPLSAGSHTLSLKTKGSSGPNVDYVTVNPQTGTGIYYLHSDHQGSVIAQSDATGKVAAALAYDAYGIPAVGNVDRFGYTGQLWFQELGLNYYKARIYSPKLGRFLQTDPIGYKDQMNLYAYVGNDPLNKTDPTGLCPTCLIGAVIGIAAEVVVQTAIEGKSFSQIDGVRVFDSAVIGAISGGVGGAAAKLAGIAGKSLYAAPAMHQGVSKIVTGALTGAIGGATGAATGSAISQAVSTGSVDGSQVGKAAITGAVFGALAGAATGSVEASAAQKTLGDSRAQTLFTSTQPGAATGAVVGSAIDTATSIGGAAKDACQQKQGGCK